MRSGCRPGNAGTQSGFEQAGRNVPGQVGGQRWPGCHGEHGASVAEQCGDEQDLVQCHLMLHPDKEAAVKRSREHRCEDGSRSDHRDMGAGLIGFIQMEPVACDGRCEQNQPEADQQCKRPVNALEAVQQCGCARLGRTFASGTQRDLAYQGLAHACVEQVEYGLQRCDQAHEAELQGAEGSEIPGQGEDGRERDRSRTDVVRQNVALKGHEGA